MLHNPEECRYKQEQALACLQVEVSHTQGDDQQCQQRLGIGQHQQNTRQGCQICQQQVCYERQ